jgi:hypothetical protein
VGRRSQEDDVKKKAADRGVAARTDGKLALRRETLKDLTPATAHDTVKGGFSDGCEFKKRGFSSNCSGQFTAK